MLMTDPRSSEASEDDTTSWLASLERGDSAERTREQVRLARSVTTLSPVAALLDSARQFTPTEFQEFVSGVLTLRAASVAPVAPARESELLLRINEGLPEDLARRLESLQAKRDAEALSDEEHQELIRLSDEAEKKEVSRLEALAELSAFRGMRLPETMSQLGLAAASDG